MQFSFYIYIMYIPATASVLRLVPIGLCFLIVCKQEIVFLYIFCTLYICNVAIWLRVTTVQFVL